MLKNPGVYSDLYPYVTPAFIQINTTYVCTSTIYIYRLGVLSITFLVLSIVLLIIGLVIRNSRLFKNFVAIGIGRF